MSRDPILKWADAFASVAEQSARLSSSMTRLGASIHEVTRALAAMTPFRDLAERVVLYRKMLAQGWTRRDAERYVLSLPDGVAWLYPTPRPRNGEAR